MKKLPITLFLTAALLVGDTTPSWSNDFKRWKMVASEETDTVLKKMGTAFQSALRSLHENNYLKAFKELEPLAEAGHLESQYQVGKLLNSSKYSKFGFYNEEKGQKWLLRAAKRGHPKAQYYYADSLSLMQKYGHQGMKWIIKSAENGFEGAQNTMGNAYRTGQGVPVDYNKSSLWYFRAAQQAQQEEPGLALHNLLHNYAGGFYGEGFHAKPTSIDPLGVSKIGLLINLVFYFEPYKAKRFQPLSYNLAIRKNLYKYGNISQLAGMFRDGKGVDKNLEIAIKIYKKLDELEPEKEHWEWILSIYDKILKEARSKRKKSKDGISCSERETVMKRLKLLNAKAHLRDIRQKLCWTFLGLEHDYDYRGWAPNLYAYLWCSLTNELDRPKRRDGVDLLSAIIKEKNMSKNQIKRAKFLAIECIRKRDQGC